MFNQLLLLLMVSQAGDVTVPPPSPIRPIQKTFVVTEEMPLSELGKISGTEDAVLRVVLKGNMLRDGWVKALNRLDARRVEAVVSRDLNDRHVAQFRKVRRMDFILDAPDGRVGANTLANLAALGPARVKLLVTSGFDGKALAEAVKTTGAKEIIIDLRGSENAGAVLSVLGRGSVSWKAKVTEKQAETLLRDIKGLGAVSLDIELGGGELPAELAYVLEKAGIFPAFTVRDTMNESGFRSLFEVSQFSLTILPASPVVINTPMIKMLNESGLK